MCLNCIEPVGLSSNVQLVWYRICSQYSIVPAKEDPFLIIPHR